MVKVQFGNPIDDAAQLRVDTELPSEYERHIRSDSPQWQSSRLTSSERRSNLHNSAALASNSFERKQSVSVRNTNAPLTTTTTHEQYYPPHRYQPQSTYVQEKTGSGVGAGIQYRPSSRAESETLVKSSAKGSIISSGGVHINVYTEPGSMSRNSPARLCDEIEVTYGDKHKQAFKLGPGPDSPLETAGPKRVYWGGIRSTSSDSPTPSNQEQNVKYRSASASRANSTFTTSDSATTFQQQQQPRNFRETLSSASTSLGLDLDRPASGMSTGSSSAGRRSVGRESPEPTFMLSSANSTGSRRSESGDWQSSAGKHPTSSLQFKQPLPRQNSSSGKNQWEIPIRLENRPTVAEGTSPLLAFSPESAASSRAENNNITRRPTPVVGTTPVMAFSPDAYSSTGSAPLSPSSITTSSRHQTLMNEEDGYDDDLREEEVDRNSTTRFRDDITMQRPGILRHPLGHVDVPLRIAGIPDSFSDKERKLAISGYGATRKQHAEEEYERRSPKRTMPPRNDALVRELKNKVDTIGERLPSRNGSYAINTEMLERRPFSPKKRFQPEYYMRAIPPYDDDGHPIPEWRRQFIAKQLAGFVKKEFEHDEGLEDEDYFLAKVDLLLNDPEWKRKMGLTNRPDSPVSGSVYGRGRMSPERMSTFE